MTQLFILMTVLICSSLRIDGRTDFKCVLTYQNWKWPTHMTINWIIPPPVFHREDLDVNITWYTSFNIGSCLEFTLTSCSWNYGHGMNFDENFYLSVIIYHKATENIVFKNEWEVNPDDCRKPPPVDKVILETKNSTCINVTWWYDENSGCSTFDHKYYHISYRNNGTTGMKDYRYEYETLETSCNTSQIFCYLQPFANYVFNIQTKFSDWQRKIRGHYSSEKLASIRTPEDERLVCVRLKVRKSVSTYPGQPRDFLVCVSGLNPSLSLDEYDRLKRCMPIGFDNWIIELWLPKNKEINFNFVVIKTETYTLVESEIINPHRAFIGVKPVLIESTFNQEGVIIQDASERKISFKMRKRSAVDRQNHTRYKQMSNKFDLVGNVQGAKTRLGYTKKTFTEKLSKARDKIGKLARFFSKYILSSAVLVLIVAAFYMYALCNTYDFKNVSWKKINCI